MKLNNDKKNISSNLKKKKTNILGLSKSIIFFIFILCVIHIYLSFDIDKKEVKLDNWNNFMSMLLITMVMASIFKYIGSKIFFLKSIGGGTILSLLVPSFIFNYDFGNGTFFAIQSLFKKRIEFFTKNTEIGFLDFFVSSLIVGSIFGISRNFLKRLFKRFIPLVIISLIISALVVGTLGIIFKPIAGIEGINKTTFHPFIDSIFYIFIPIASGGIAAGIVPLSKIFSQRRPADENLFKSHLMPSLLVAGIISVIISGLIKKIFGKTKYSGPNNIMEKKHISLQDEKKILKKENNINFNNLNTGLVIIFSFFVFSSICRNLILKLLELTSVSSIIKYYIPPVIVFLAVFMLLFQFFNSKSIPLNYIQGVEQACKFIQTNFTSVILVMLGSTVDINKVIVSISNFYFLITCFLCVITTALSSAIIGDKFGYYPVQSSIVAGLCSNSIGGAGNLAILEASDSLELMTYAQVSTRLGGLIVVIISSIFFPFFYLC
ncbi:MAG: 2-hydroxycarboxylate transporter family protein [Candidatus Phytoplasma stylosanthis]|uniref:2-hydroxycarboxylate transporter family protein n=1 Tax=Candidatus Phytoplasma stylosanthis TaxID=2798314 RepID=UPI002939F6C6|nr:2-hydroxycarboxylate transporter family protein [Candidatus Phytoplasma stylosanthis]MDV3170817.1 2-hydroxycarboxylate transporter family protein [Candidatus Phytoplasma stylosanthis]